MSKEGWKPFSHTGTSQTEYGQTRSTESPKSRDRTATSENKPKSKDKTQGWALLWNVNEKRVESLHESKEAAEDAGRKFTEKSGTNFHLTDLAVATFTVPLPEPPADHSSEVKKAKTLADKRAEEDNDLTARRAKEDAELAAKVRKDDAARVTTHIPPALENRADAPAGHPEGSTDATPAAKTAAEERNVDLDEVEGSGAGGRVTKADVVAADPED